MSWQRGSLKVSNPNNSDILDELFQVNEVDL